MLALERHGLAPGRGPAIVTGAAGGVGSVAIALLSKLGWHVIASTGRVEEADYLKELGAAEIIDRAELSGPGRPLGKERWAAGVDSVGSHTLANLLAQTEYAGAIAACGLAQGMDLPASVAPFILRGVSLLGIDSVMCPQPLRREAWERLARDLDRGKLKRITYTIPFDKVIDTAGEISQGKFAAALWWRSAKPAGTAPPRQRCKSSKHVILLGSGSRASAFPALIAKDNNNEQRFSTRTRP